MNRKTFSAGIFALILTSCGTHRQAVSTNQGERLKRKPTYEHEVLTPERSPWEARDENPKVADDLRLFVKDWEGTPHKMGGNTKKGVDCSGFVIQAYLQVYQLSFIGRRAEDLFGETKPIKREDLQEGDLVFFKINGKRIDHVGIYLNNGDFAHASYSSGVMISNLGEPYYDKRFFMGGRKTNGS